LGLDGKDIKLQERRVVVLKHRMKFDESSVFPNQRDTEYEQSQRSG
jgi:hypothetical protein